MSYSHWKHQSLPINTATLVERIEAMLRNEDNTSFSREELEALHERLLEFLPDLTEMHRSKGVTTNGD